MCSCGPSRNPVIHTRGCTAGPTNSTEPHEKLPQIDTVLRRKEREALGEGCRNVGICAKRAVIEDCNVQEAERVEVQIVPIVGGGGRCGATL